MAVPPLEATTALSLQGMPSTSVLDDGQLYFLPFSLEKAYTIHSEKSFSRYTSNSDSAIQLVEVELWFFVTPDTRFYSPKVQFRSDMHHLNQAERLEFFSSSTIKIKLVGSRTTMEIKQIFEDGIYQNCSTGFLLELQEDVGYRFGVRLPNFCRQHLSVSIP
ncbi:hypothetical protein TNCV_2150241 [Trichonephila clavipes]|nr:hypothetical protein TNCV_2150241 [Trichonephila clavipes]